MLPKHRSECNLEPPFQTAYYENEFGSKSIGEPKWKPHIRNALDFPNCQEHSIKGGNGLDWFSRIRCPLATERKISRRFPEPFESKISNTSPAGSFENQEKATNPAESKHSSQRSSQPENREENKYESRVWEMTLEKALGRKRKVRDRRNGLGEQAPGDKSYHVPECEAKFHSHGSTLPSVSLGALRETPDTFIPLVRLPLKPRIPFYVKERREAKMKELQEVKDLDDWKPADPLRIS